jgi:hypothetical protein
VNRAAAREDLRRLYAERDALSRAIGRDIDFATREAGFCLAEADRLRGVAARGGIAAQARLTKPIARLMQRAEAARRIHDEALARQPEVERLQREIDSHPGQLKHAAQAA